MFWGLVEKLTGVNAQVFKDVIRGKALDFVESATCQCGHGYWFHIKNGHCMECVRHHQDSPCQKFVARSEVPPSQPTT
jgi:hypothetical protein